MAELLLAGGWAEPKSLIAYLRDTLPDDFVMVGDTTLWGELFEAIVVAPSGILILDPVGPREAGNGKADRNSEDGGSPEPVQRRRKVKALQAFMRDEFPALASDLKYAPVTPEPHGDTVIWRLVEQGTPSAETLSETITGMAPIPDGPLADEALCHQVAVALRDHQLTASQRASKPFVFRSGNLLRGGTKVWTICDAVRHMDRHPADGIHHLCNGTLARWLTQEGAKYLADMGMNAVHQAGADRRQALEVFLVGTGLVKRPPIVILPEYVDMGYMLSGERRGQAFRVRRGSGHTSGELEPSEPWVWVEPRTFKSTPIHGVVTVDTNTLLIKPTPYETPINVTLKETGKRIRFFVRFRVEAEPSPASRYLLRPLTGLGLAALIGAFIGLLWGFVGILPPSWLSAGATSGALRGWSLPIGLIWAILGAARGFLQPLEWPIGYATRRWVVRTAAWSVGLAVTSALCAWCWSTGPQATLLSAPPLSHAALIGAALGILPSLIGEARARRAARSRTFVFGQRRGWRPILKSSAWLALLFGLLLAPQAIQPAWQRAAAQGQLHTAKSWVEDGWTGLNAKANDLLGRYYLQYYDRRAPARPRPEPPVESVEADIATQ